MAEIEYPYAPRSPVKSSHDQSSKEALNALHAPALGLLIFAVVSILAGTLSFVLFVLVPPENLTETVQSVTAMVSAGVNAFVFYGALCMRHGENYGVALTAAILASIPLLSACIWFGIPFGIWALIVLRRPAVRAAFTT
jgi:hypothetical protein